MVGTMRTLRLALAFALLALAPAFIPPAAAAARVELVYFGAHDCFYCQHWEAARRPELLELLRGRDAALVEVRGDSLAAPILRRHYPPGHAWLHDRLGDLRGVPRFVLVVDGKVALTVAGTSAYSERMVPALRKALDQGRAGR